MNIRKLLSAISMAAASAVIASSLAVFSACTKEDLEVDNDDNTPTIETPIEFEKTFSIIRINASSPDADTKTSLVSNKVVWDAGDKITLIRENIPTLGISLNGASQSLGIGVSSNISSPMLKYKDISVSIGGKDVTESILSSNAENGESNSYKIGMINKSGNYVLPKPESSVTTSSKYKASGFLSLSRTYGIPIIATSSSSSISSSNAATVTVSGLQYSTDGGNNWTVVDNSTTLLYGSSFTTDFKDASYEWISNNTATLTLDSGEAEAVGSFVGLADNSFEQNSFAVFPDSAVKDYRDGVLTFSIPKSQTYAENSFGHSANVMVGSVDMKGTEYHSSLKNMMGVLQLSLTGNGCSVSTISVTDRAGHLLCGEARVQDSSIFDGISTSNFTSGESTVTLTCGNGTVLSDEPKQFNVVVPVGAFADGLDITVTTTDGKVSRFGSSSSKNTIARSEVKVMPTKDIRTSFVSVLNIHNAAVAKYLSYSDAPSFSQGKSLFDSHSKELSEEAFIGQDHPNYFNIEWEKNGSSEYFVTLTDNTKGKDVFSNRSTGSSTTYSFMNMIPGHKYSYKVTDGSSANLTAGAFTVTGFVREVTIDDSWNWRDLGGWVSTLGGTVRYEWIYRGGSLNGRWTKGTSKVSKSEVGNINNYEVLSSSSQQQILDMGIKSELDLRSTVSEHGNTTDYSHSVSLEVAHTGLSEWYFNRIKTADALSNPLSNDAIVRDVEWIIDEVRSGHPVAFHCKSGADRTGAVALTILALLGVDEENIAREYELTRFSHEQQVVTGKAEFRDRKASTGEVHDFFANGFGKIDKPTLQEKAYYYLHGSFANTKISTEKLDWFINYMLNISSYQHPSWAD